MISLLELSIIVLGVEQQVQDRVGFRVAGRLLQFAQTRNRPAKSNMNIQSRKNGVEFPDLSGSDLGVSIDSAILSIMTLD